MSAVELTVLSERVAGAFEVPGVRTPCFTRHDGARDEGHEEDYDSRLHSRNLSLVLELVSVIIYMFIHQR